MQRYLLLILIFFFSKTYAADLSLKLHYQFNNVINHTDSVYDETGNGCNAKLNGSAMVYKLGSYNVMKIGSSSGYADMGSKVGNIVKSLNNFTISTYIYIDPVQVLTNNGNFICSFSNAADIATSPTGCMFYSAKDSRYSICKTNYTAEKSVSMAIAATKGEWVQVTYTQSGTTGTVYLNGVVAKTGTISILPSALGTTPYNYLAKSPYASDALLLNSMFYDFRIYNRALPLTEITTLCTSKALLDSTTYRNIVETTTSSLLTGDLTGVTSSLTLPTSKNGCTISWQTNNSLVVTNTGVVTRPLVNESNANVMLTATISYGSTTIQKTFNLTVLAWKYSDSGSVQIAADSLKLTGNISNLHSNLQLPAAGVEGTTITWTSGNLTYINDRGVIQQKPVSGAGKQNVTLTALISRGNAQAVKTFDIYIAEKEIYTDYLFVYFIGNTNNGTTNQEALRFGLSNDGKNYLSLNANNYVIASDTISLSGGIRDPHILRGEDGKTFYMVVTDMKSSQGWDSNRGIILMKSTDLIHWAHTAVNFPSTFPSTFADVIHVWAPQTIYDKAAGKYMIYFALKRSTGGVDNIYYAYANADFTGLESEPQLLFAHPDGAPIIDSDIIEKEGRYYMFMKATETGGAGIKKAIASSVTGPYVLQNGFLDQTDLGVEGSCVYRLTNTDEYILMYDIYANGQYQFTQSSDLDNFTVVDRETSMNFAPRHGTAIPITSAEAQRLAERWGNVSDIQITGTSSNQVKPINCKFDQTVDTIYLALKRTTDITNFDPQFVMPAGCVISPVGVQDFSNGPITFSVSISGVGSLSYQVRAEVNGNPVIEGYYADPEILYSQQTGKFYIYPTTDGFASWGGYYFNVFSSPDLVNWTNEGTIIDMHDSNQITWATGNAWAPCIVERKINGSYQYSFFFSGGLNGGAKRLGYATSASPTGPFTVSANPLVTSSPTGSGQQIDSDVFIDPVSGKTYLYWGNGYMAVAQINDDNTLATTPQVITPSSNYTEGTYVFYRNGKYYFTWSYGNTSNADYRVYYGYSDSPTGPITIPVNNSILLKNTVIGINGPGHNSIVQIPGKDEWYIVYHRISRPNGINNTSPGPGNVRELCIDKLEFNTDGTIKPVLPTIKGINPVSLVYTDAVSPMYENQVIGNLKKVEIYTLSGIKYRGTSSLPVGLYLLKKTYTNGQVAFEKEYNLIKEGLLERYSELIQ